MGPRRRPANREAPIYVDNKFCTLKIHYGGKFVHLPASYEGGDIIFIDYVEQKTLSLPLMDKMVQECGLHGITLFYRIDELKKFRLMRSDIDVFLMLGHGFVSNNQLEFSVYLNHEPMERLVSSRDEEGNTQKVKRGGKTNASTSDVSNIPTAAVPPKVNKRKNSCEASGSGKVNKRGKSNGVNYPSSAPTELNINDDAPLPSQVQSQPDFITPSFPLPPFCNPIAPTLNIRGHAPTSFQPNPGAPPPFPVTVIDGKKYVTLANLPAACKTLKSAKNLK